MKLGVRHCAVSGVRLSLFIILGALSIAVSSPASAAPPAPRAEVSDAKAVISGRFIVERPTLISAGFEWVIEGDSNRTAKVEVSFRKKGETAWRPALPMMRLQNEKLKDPPHQGGVDYEHVIDYTCPNAFAGSVLNLEPGTEYEFRFVLSDPDGVKGPHEKTVALKTRTEPMPAQGGKVYHVYPFDWKGPKQEPAFTGLLAAYYTGAFDADFWNADPPRVQPGDIILVHAGVYKDMAFRYYMADSLPVKGEHLSSYGTFFDGTYYLHQSGTPDKPIVIKSAGDGEVVFDGNDVAVLFDLTKANYNYFEGITVRNASIAFLLGRKAYWGADGFTLKHCKIEDVGRGVHEDWGLSKDFYIADNVFIGRTPADRLVGHAGAGLWGQDPAWPVPLNMNPGGSEYAVKVYGQGHVVAYNRVERWHDGIDIATYGNPDATCEKCDSANPQRPTLEEDLPSSIDFYGNDISNTNDNCFEMDGGARNIRYFRNRCFNSANPGLSISPGFGGPFYFFQNVLYNQVNGAITGGQSSGLLYYQNTIVGEIRANMMNEHFLNNLILATGSSVGPGGSQTINPAPTPVLAINTKTNYSSSDYNGFRVDPRAAAAFRWNSPPDNVAADYDPTHETIQRNFKTLQEYGMATGQDKHSVLLDYDSLEKVSMPDRTHIQKLYDPADFDFRLKAGSKAIDAGIILPTINDGYSGKAPDLGAYEYGSEIPHYGPRP